MALLKLEKKLSFFLKILQNLLSILELFKNLRTRPGPSQLTEASLTRLTKPYTTRTPYRPGGSLRFDSTPSPTGEHGSTLASPGSTLTTQPSSDITFTDGLSFNPQYSPLKPAFPELLRNIQNQFRLGGGDN